MDLRANRKLGTEIKTSRKRKSLSYTGRDLCATQQHQNESRRGSEREYQPDKEIKIGPCAVNHEGTGAKTETFGRAWLSELSSRRERICLENPGAQAENGNGRKICSPQLVLTDEKSAGNENRERKSETANLIEQKRSVLLWLEQKTNTSRAPKNKTSRSDQWWWKNSLEPRLQSANENQVLREPRNPLGTARPHRPRPTFTKPKPSKRQANGDVDSQHKNMSPDKNKPLDLL
jgi:hypothetical protein